MATCLARSESMEGRNFFDGSTEFFKFVVSVAAMDGLGFVAGQSHPQFRGNAPVRQCACERVPQRMETALTYTLQRVHWQFFAALTFQGAKLPERVRLSLVFAFVRRVCRWHKVPFRKCVWALC
jgi:hypothetical protein